jgi:hypothetical protein
MIESGARELHHTAPGENPDPISGHQAADSRDRAEAAGDRVGHRAEPRERHREEQFVIFAARERVFARQLASDRLRERLRDRKGRSIHFRTAPAGGA